MFSIHLLHLSFHQLFICHPHPLICPLPFSITFIHSSTLPHPSLSSYSFHFKSHSSYNHLFIFPFLSLIIFILSSVAVSFCTSILPSNQPSLHVLIPSSIHASLPPASPFMCRPLVKKQHRSQIVQPLTCRCFVFLFLPHNYKHFDLTHTYKDSLETHTSTHN